MPLKYFKIIEALLKPFVWGSSRHKLAWQALKNPADLSGTVLLDFNLYYVASQLSQLYHVDKTDRERFLQVLCPKRTRRTNDPIYAIAVDSSSTEPHSQMKTLLYHYSRIWDIASRKLGTPQYNDYNLLWHNKNMPNSCSCRMWICGPLMVSSTSIILLQMVLSNPSIILQKNSHSLIICCIDIYKLNMRFKCIFQYPFPNPLQMSLWQW